jgi:hypothetical protein
MLLIVKYLTDTDTLNLRLKVYINIEIVQVFLGNCLRLLYALTEAKLFQVYVEFKSIFFSYFVMHHKLSVFKHF